MTEHRVIPNAVQTEVQEAFRIADKAWPHDRYETDGRTRGPGLAAA